MAGAVCRELSYVTGATAFSMEGPTDKMSIENEAGDGVEAPGRDTEDATQSESAEEPPPKTDGGPTDNACAVEMAASCGPTATEGSRPPGTECSASSETPTLAPAPQQCSQCTPRASVAEMDCLICFNRYSASRLPKLLACQHAFCAVCLKLILRNEDCTWIITCPLCRKSTIVFGGLICSLRDKEDVLGRLDSPDPEVAVACPPQPVATNRANRCSISVNSEPQSHRAVAKRTVLVLLLVIMLIALVLPFMCTGLLKWALCSAVVLGLIISAVLCCSPSWNCSDCSWPLWRKKETHVVSVA